MCPLKKTKKIVHEKSEVKFLSRHDLKEFPRESDTANPLSIYTPDEIRNMVLEQALQEAEEIKQKAFEEGYNNGKLQAEQEIKQVLDGLESIFQKSIEKIIQVKTDFLEQLTPQILKLIFQIAEKVITVQINMNQNIVMQIVKETINELIESQEIHLHLHPDDFSIVENYITSHMNDKLSHQHVIFVPDEAVEKGGCIAETKTLYIDNQISSRLQLIVEHIINSARENGVNL